MAKFSLVSLHGIEVIWAPGTFYDVVGNQQGNAKIQLTLHESIDSALENMVECLKELEEFVHGSFDISSVMIATAKYQYRVFLAQRDVQNAIATWKTTNRVSSDLFIVGMASDRIDKMIALYEQLYSCVKGMSTLNGVANCVDYIAANFASNSATIGTDPKKYGAVLIDAIMAQWKQMLIATPPFRTIGSHTQSTISAGTFLTGIQQRAFARENPNKTPPTDVISLTTTAREYSRLLVAWDLMFFAQYEQLKAYAELKGITF